MSKNEVESKICQFCESQYKLSYNPEDASGFSKYCPFCGEVEGEGQEEAEEE
jgi:hypothetical protein